jgi:MFS family permease
MIRIGFRPWLSFLLVAWGIVAVCFMFISSPWSFYLLRVLLGVFEAGAFPCMWYALSVFIPRKRWARAGVWVGGGKQAHAPQVAHRRPAVAAAAPNRPLPRAPTRRTLLPPRLIKPYAWLTMGIMGANVIGSPLALGLLAMDGVGGLRWARASGCWAIGGLLGGVRQAS